MKLDFGDLAIADEWLYKAAGALVTFWRPDQACFLRATGPKLVGRDSTVGEFAPETGATSSNRAFLALTEVLFFLAEEGIYSPSSSPNRPGRHPGSERWSELAEQLDEMWSSMAQRYYHHSIEVLRGHSENGRNDFTDAHLMVSLSVLTGKFARNHLGHAEGDTASTALGSLISEFAGTVSSKGGARIADSGQTHPLLTLHAVRALEIAQHVTGPPDGRSRVSDTLETVLRTGARDDLLRQLGLHDVGDAEFDPAALLGDVALLHRFAGLSGRRLVERGVELLGATQGFDGSWKSAALTGRQKVVWLPSLELAVALSNVVLADLADGSDRLAHLAAPILERSVEFLEAGYSESKVRDGDLQSGWTNDQARQPDVVESWSTALAIQLLLRLRRISRRLKQHGTLQRYRTAFPERSQHESLRWPDTAGPIGLVRSVAIDKKRAKGRLERVSDPSSGASLDRAIWSDVVRPILTDVFARPTETASFLLYGPPGTRKSSMVESIAGALGWPLVTLAPPDFLTQGMVGLESRAEEIFRDLLGLRRVVVFFDECEELFRRRTVVNAPEHRVQSDFITSGMLPRLQDLRDGRWVVFAIATNTELDELDPAVVRFGRIDGQQRVGHPEIAAQLRYLKANGHLSPDQFRRAKKVLVKYDNYLASEISPVSRDELVRERRTAKSEYERSGDLREYFSTADRVRARESELPLVTFAVLDAFARTARNSDTAQTKRELATLLREISGSKGRPRQWTERYE